MYDLISFDLCIDPWNRYHNQQPVHFHPQSLPLPVPPRTTSPGGHWPAFCRRTLVCISQKFMSGEDVEGLKALWTAVWARHSDLHTPLPNDPTTPLLGAYFREMKIRVHPRPCARMFLMVSFLVAPNWAPQEIHTGTVPRAGSDLSAVRVLFACPCNSVSSRAHVQARPPRSRRRPGAALSSHAPPPPGTYPRVSSSSPVASGMLHKWDHAACTLEIAVFVQHHSSFVSLVLCVSVARPRLLLSAAPRKGLPLTRRAAGKRSRPLATVKKAAWASGYRLLREHEVLLLWGQGPTASWSPSPGAEKERPRYWEPLWLCHAHSHQQCGVIKFPDFLPAFGIITKFLKSHSGSSVVMSYCGFSLHLLNSWRRPTSFHVLMWHICMSSLVKWLCVPIF